MAFVVVLLVLGSAAILRSRLPTRIAFRRIQSRLYDMTNRRTIFDQKKEQERFNKEFDKLSKKAG
jgi:hypothetical protein